MFIREIISEGEVIQGNFPNNSSPTENFTLQVFMSPAPGVQPDWIPSKPGVIKDQYDLSKNIDDSLANGVKAEHIKVQLNGTYINMPEFGITENLRAWFGKGKKGGAGGGGWDRYNTKGERTGKCGDSGEGAGKPKCLSKSKAASLRAKGGKAAIGAAVRKKRRNDPNKNRKGKAKNVSNTTRSKKQEIMMNYLAVAKDWVMDRIGERTSLDGVALIAVCGSVILFGGIVKLAAWVGLGYGIYTLVKKEG